MKKRKEQIKKRRQYHLEMYLKVIEMEQETPEKTIRGECPYKAEKIEV